VNDKFKGVNPEAEQTIKALKDKYKLDKTGFLSPKDLSNHYHPTKIEFCIYPDLKV